MLFPVLVAVVAAGMAAVAIVAAQLRCIDAAREGARAAARGEPATVVRRLAVAAAPSGAQVSVSYQGDRVTVAVAADVRVVTRLLPPASVDARAAAQLEPDAVGTDGTEDGDGG